MVVPAVCLLVVVHECVQVWKVAVQVDVSGVPSTHQVAIELWTLLSRRQNSFQISAYVVLSQQREGITGRLGIYNLAVREL